MEKKKEENKKFSYEELNNFAHQLTEQNNKLFMELQKANLANMFKRLDYLFKVVDNQIAFPQEFVDKCINEIQEMMTIPEKEEEEKKDEN